MISSKTPEERAKEIADQFFWSGDPNKPVLIDVCDYPMRTQNQKLADAIEEAIREAVEVEHDYWLYETRR